jgi:hypothetical protein
MKIVNGEFYLPIRMTASSNPSPVKLKSKTPQLGLPEGLVADQGKIFVAHGTWKKNITNQSLNWKELKTVELALREFLPKLMEKKISSVLIRMDNTAAMFNINRKSASQSLYKILRRLLNWVDNHKLYLKAVHIPGDINKVTDSLRRMETNADYQIEQCVLKEAVTKLRFVS